MQLHDLQQELTSRSIALSLDVTGKLKSNGPKGTMTPELTDAIREHKAELLGRLLYAQVRDTLSSYPPETRFTLDGQTYSRYNCCLKLGRLLYYDGDTATVRAFLATLSPESQGRQTPEHTEPEPAPSGGKKKGRAVVYVDMHAGRAITETGAVISFPPLCSLSELYHTVHETYPCNGLYLCGALPDSYETWLIDAAMWEEHTTGKRGHYFDTKEAENHVARYQHRISGEELEIRTLYSWFGDTEYTVEQAHAATSLLNQYLKRAFTTQAKAYATPALTFQQLWLTENRLQGKQFAPLPEEIRTLIHGSTGQGRIELCTPATTEKLPGLYYYDGVFMYAGLTWNMPTELASHDTENLYAGNTPARYRVRYTVPLDWQHIGPFMTPKEQVTGNAQDSDSWCYPGDTCQGQTFETWADGAELDVLVQHYAPFPQNATAEDKAQARTLGIARSFAAWNITIVERMVFKADSSKKPLDSITHKLVKMREQIEQDARQDASRLALYQLVRGMVRNILLHGIGSFHRTNRDVTYILRASEPAPDGYTDIRPLGDNAYVYTVPQKTESYTQQFEHPEWTALIWARCRARMTRTALSLPRTSVIAIRTDAIAVSTEQPQWRESEKIGTLREKWHITKKLEAPHSLEALDKLVKKHTKEV